MERKIIKKDIRFDFFSRQVNAAQISTPRTSVWYSFGQTGGLPPHAGEKVKCKIIEEDTQGRRRRGEGGWWGARSPNNFQVLFGAP